MKAEMGTVQLIATGCLLALHWENVKRLIVAIQLCLLLVSGR